MLTDVLRASCEPHWGDAGVGPYCSPAQMDSYVVFYFPEADADTHNMKAGNGSN